MEKLLSGLRHTLTCRRITLAVAESCTGGLISCLLTDKPGSSHFFILGVVAYSNKAKEKILGISAKTIAAKGAVSAGVARLMAQRIRKIAASDLGLGITGIAGPQGATKDKPVGTVFIAAADRKITLCRKLLLKGSRAGIRKKSALLALKLLNKII